MMNIHINKLCTLFARYTYGQMHIIYAIFNSTKFPIIYTSSYEENMPLTFHVTTFIQSRMLWVHLLL